MSETPTTPSTTTPPTAGRGPLATFGLLLALGAAVFAARKWLLPAIGCPT